MASRLLFSLGLATCVAATALPRAEAPASSTGFLSLPIEHRRASVPIMKRADDTDVPLFNISVISYLIAMSIGTPGQDVKVAIDTGSDELWVNPQCSTVQTSEQRSECLTAGRYDPESSSTSSVSQATNKIPYGKGEAIIQYVKDSISLPSSTISLKNVIFGDALRTSELSEGILGLGYGNGTNLQYPNFVDTLAEQGATQSRAFTVALGSADANNGGVIIFGGVDTKKFSGQLVGVPILGPQGRETVRRYWVQMESVGITPQGGSAKTYTGGKMPIVLDSGSSLSYLPGDLVDQMAADTNAKWDATNEIFAVSCSLISSQSTFDFTFGGGASVNGSSSSTVKISVPYREFIWQAGRNDCVLGALPINGTTTTALLGDSFLRSAYTVFDQTSNAIFLAQYANCGQNERAIPASPVGAVGSFAGECNPGQDISNTGKKSAAARPAGPGMAPWLGAAAAVVAAQVLVGAV